VYLEYVEDYTYLGQIISFKNKTNKEISKRVSQAWKSFWAQKWIFKGKLKIASKVKMLEACIIPILTYGAQTWSLTQAQARRLVTAQRAFERSLLNIRKSGKIKARV